MIGWQSRQVFWHPAELISFTHTARCCWDGAGMGDISQPPTNSCWKERVRKGEREREKERERKRGSESERGTHQKTSAAVHILHKLLIPVLSTPLPSRQRLLLGSGPMRSPCGGLPERVGHSRAPERTLHVCFSTNLAA